MTIDIAPYRAASHRRRQAEQELLAQRKERAWGTARQAAKLLKERFGATKVLLFGSLAHNLWFSTTSDIDLAAWGIAPEDYFRAVAKLQDLSPEFSIDLVTMEECTLSLSNVVVVEGIPL